MKRHTAYLIIALITCMFSQALIAEIRLMPFASFLASITLSKTLSFSLWTAFGLGLFTDLLSTNLPFGSHALTFCLSVVLLFPKKNHFFEGEPFSFFLFTVIFSFIITFLEKILHKFFEIPIASSFFFDFIIMPIIDGLYAYFFFYIPLLCYRYLRRNYLR